jgi:SAM-dependent methyltransferase
MNTPESIRKTVSSTYTRAVESNQANNRSCCAGPAPQGLLTTLAGYNRETLAQLPPDAVVNSFGCGNPVALAEIREGDTVLDLGSGAGIDLLLAAKLTGPRGWAMGVDMTPAMVERARANAAAAGLQNVVVTPGIIEDLPLESASVDLVLSNCVINLSPEKSKVFQQIHRVLKPGGRFSISDIVAEPMPDWVLELGALYSACVSGAIPEADYVAGLRSAGLDEVTVVDRLVYGATELRGLLDSEVAGSCCSGSAGMPREQVLRVADALAGRVASIRVVGRKPVEGCP